MRTKLLSILILGSLLSLAACGGSSSGGGSAELRVVHGSPDAPNVDVFVDDEGVLSNVPFGVASDYLTIESGNRNIKVNAAGSELTVIDVSPRLAKNVSYTVIASNFLATIEPILLVDDRRIPASGTIKVRVVHAAPSAPAVDVYITEPNADIETVEPVLANVAFSSASDYLTVASGAYQVRVTPAGTKLAVIDTGALELDERGVFTAIALDAAGGGLPPTALLLRDR